MTWPFSRGDRNGVNGPEKPTDARVPRFEERRATLAEFYPDPEERHALHYTFAHRFLPMYVWQNAYACFKASTQPGLDLSRYVQARWTVMFLEMIGKRRPMSTEPGEMVTDLTARAVDVGGRAGVLVCMPPPVQMAGAHCVVFVSLVPPETLKNFDPDSPKHVRVFTLERSADQGEDEMPDVSRPAVLGGWEPDRHLNFGMIPSTVDAFLDSVAARLD